MGLDWPPVRKWELNSTATRYDYSASAPSDQDLHIMWAILAAINAVVATFCLLILVSILRNQKVRRNPFNLYLVYLLIPDLFSSGMCFITCAASSAAYRYYSNAMCSWQSFYLTWGFTSNCWLNAVIAYQLHRMLRESWDRKRYIPPTLKRVTLQAMAVYLYAVFVGMWGVWDIPWLPHRTGAYSGFACFPQDYDLASTLFFWLVFIPAFLVLPLLYVGYVCWDVHRRGMLPPSGRRRNLAVYFLRLVFVFVFMWLPFVIIAFVVAGNQSWVFWAGAAWSHLQGIVSALASLTKKDIKDAFLNFVSCGRYAPQDDGDNRGSVLGSESSQRFSFMRSMVVRNSSMLQSMKKMQEELSKIEEESDREELSMEMFTNFSGRESSTNVSTFKIEEIEEGKEDDDEFDGGSLRSRQDGNDELTHKKRNISDYDSLYDVDDKDTEIAETDSALHNQVCSDDKFLADERDGEDRIPLEQQTEDWFDDNDSQPKHQQDGQQKGSCRDEETAETGSTLQNQVCPDSDCLAGKHGVEVRIHLEQRFKDPLADNDCNSKQLPQDREQQDRERDEEIAERDSSMPNQVTCSSDADCLAGKHEEEDRRTNQQANDSFVDNESNPNHTQDEEQ